MRILCTGDLHLGRPASRVAEAHSPRRFSPLAGWKTLVDRALAERVDLVLLTGDVVDRDNRFFEALGPLERELGRLAEAGIRTFGISGNHDFDVLPRLAEALPDEHFRLLGRGGRWEEAIVECDGRPVLRLHGWSFPREHVQHDPLTAYDLTRDDSLPTLGLLHADLDDPNSNYAPVALADLQHTPVTAWLLGHIHKPALYEEPGAPPVLYPGSPTALHPGETGPHGPWLLEVLGPRRMTATQLPLSPIRYESFSVDLDGAATKAEFETRLTAAVRDQLAAVEAESGGACLLSMRLTLLGRTPLRREIDAWVSEMLPGYTPSAGRLEGRIELATNDTRPAIDLEELAGAYDAPGTIARLVLDLDRGGQSPESQRLIAEARQRIGGVHGSSAFALVAQDAEPDEQSVRQLLIDEGLSLIDALLAQKETD